MDLDEFPEPALLDLTQESESEMEDTLYQIGGGVTLLISIPLAILYYAILTKCFDIVYIGCQGIFTVVAICFVAAFFTVAFVVTALITLLKVIWNGICNVAISVWPVIYWIGLIGLGLLALLLVIAALGAIIEHFQGNPQEAPGDEKKGVEQSADEQVEGSAVTGEEFQIAPTTSDIEPSSVPKSEHT